MCVASVTQWFLFPVSAVLECLEPQLSFCVLNRRISLLMPARLIKKLECNEMKNLLLCANWNQLKKGEAWVFWVLARVVTLLKWNKTNWSEMKWKISTLYIGNLLLLAKWNWLKKIPHNFDSSPCSNERKLFLLSLLYILHSFARSKVVAWDFCLSLHSHSPFSLSILTLHSHSPFSILCLTARVLDLCQNTGCFAVLICLALYFSFSLKIINFISFCNALYTGFFFYQRIKSLRKFSSHSGNGSFSDDSKEAISKKATNKGIISSCL